MSEGRTDGRRERESRQVYRGIEEMARGSDLIALAGPGSFPACVVGLAVGATRSAASAAYAAAASAARSDLALVYSRRSLLPYAAGGEFRMVVQTRRRAARVRVAVERDGWRMDEWVRRHVLDGRCGVKIILYYIILYYVT